MTCWCCYATIYAEPGMNNLYLKSSKDGGKCNSVAEALAESICHVMPVVHVTCRCDTTSRLYGSPTEKISSAGEKALVSLCGGKINDSLNGLRKTKFSSMFAKSLTTVEV